MAKYIGLYVGCPAIAESRIIKYDGEIVTYKYTRYEDNKTIVETVHIIRIIDDNIMKLRKAICNYKRNNIW